jgi:hypothetical protein
MFWASLCPSSGAYQLQQQPVVYLLPYKIMFCKLTVEEKRSLMTIGKPEAAAAVHRLLMMGIRMPETC